MIKQEKWLIIGGGWISDNFCKDAVLENQIIAGVWSKDFKQAKELAKKYGTDNAYNNFDDIDIEYDNVYIAVPNAYHYDIAKRFIKLGKNTLVEKPMTHSYKLTKELFDLGDKESVKVMEAYPHFFPGRFENLRGKGQSLKVDFWNPLEGRTGFTNQFKKETFGGAIADSGVYAISMAIWLNGLVDKIDIGKIIIHDSGVDGTTSYTLHHKNGSITKSTISITTSGDNGIYLDGKLLDNGVSRWVDGRMREEVKTFVEGNYKFSREVSLESAKVVDEIHKHM